MVNGEICRLPKMDGQNSQLGIGIDSDPITPLHRWKCSAGKL